MLGMSWKHGIAIAAIVYLMDGLRQSNGKIALPVLGSVPTFFTFSTSGILSSLGASSSSS